MTTRTFTATPAVRHQVPLMVGLVGPSGGGKTYSALRIATGIQKVSGGEIYFIDTEANRALHYADKFKFQHMPFGAPFSPLDYLQAIEYCAKQGAKTIIIDSLSHEHEGPGGVLEMHESEIIRLSKGDESKMEANKFRAWSKPKADRRRLINSILQMNLNLICCFRAKEKLKMIKNSKGYMEPTTQGWQPIAGEEFVFEMTLNCLLLPNANGVPTWNPEEKAEQQMIKLPSQFKAMLPQGTVLSEDVGMKLAQWAKGGTVAATQAPVALPVALPVAQAPAKATNPISIDPFMSELTKCVSMDELVTAWKRIYPLVNGIDPGDMKKLTKCKDEVKATFTTPAPAANQEAL